MFFLFLGFGFLCQVTTHLLPGKNPMLYYFCLGKMPKNLLDENFKGNPSVNLMALITIALLVITSIRFAAKKFRDKKEVELKPLSIQTYLKQRASEESVFV